MSSLESRLLIVLLVPSVFKLKSDTQQFPPVYPPPPPELHKYELLLLEAKPPPPNPPNNIFDSEFFGQYEFFFNKIGSLLLLISKPSLAPVFF